MQKRPPRRSRRKSCTWWTFRIFFIFFCSGRGKGESEAPGEGGGRFLVKIPGGGVSRTGGAEGPGGRPQRIGEFWRGGVKYFFSGPKCPRSAWETRGKTKQPRKNQKKQDNRTKKVQKKKLHLVDVSDIFYFFLLGEGEGGVRGAGRGGGVGF